MTSATASSAQQAVFALALACIRTPMAAGTAPAIREAASRIDDWSQAVAVIRRHRIAGLAHRALTAHAIVMPTIVHEELARQAAAIARVGLLLSNESIRLSTAFRDAGIEVGFLKGPVLSLQLHGDVGRRHSRDLDLVVSRADLAGAAALLQRLGYAPAGDMATDGLGDWAQRMNQWDFRHRDSGILVELHWRLCPNAELGDPLAAVLDWTEVDIGGGRSVRTLSGVPLALYLCLHGSLHAWSRLKWLADIDVLISADTEAPRRLLTLADRVGLRRPAGQALWLASELLDTPLDAATRDSLAADQAVQRLAAVARATMMTGGGATELGETALGTTRVRLSHFSLGQGWRHWRAQLWLGLVSSDDLKLMRLPRWLAFLYPVLRPALWILRKRSGVRTMRRQAAQQNGRANR